MNKIILFYTTISIVFFSNFDVVAGQNKQFLYFGGIKWNVRHAGIDSPPVQPGNNYFSSSYGPGESVYVDEAGRLHLAVNKKEGVWHSAEVSSYSMALNGRYLFRVTLPNTPPVDPKVAIAMFLYSDDEHEYDIEISQFLSRFDCSLIDCKSCVNQCNDCQIQFVRQPFCESGSWQRYAWPRPLHESIHEIILNRGEIVELSSSDRKLFPRHTISHQFPENTGTNIEYHLHLSIWLKDEGGAENPNTPSKPLRQEVIFEALEIPVDMYDGYSEHLKTQKLNSQ